MQNKRNRRNFIKAALALGGGAVVFSRLIGRTAPGSTQTTDTIFVPKVLKYEPTEPPAPSGSGVVVHAHSNDALRSDWSFQANYWDYVDQAGVDRMVDEGVKTLTGQSSLAAAWRALLPDYRSGQVVAIKVSFNNGDKADDTMIDSVIEPVNAIIRGLNAIGVPNASIVVFDSQRPIRQRFIDGCDFAGVAFRDSRSDPWGSGSEAITFRPPSQPAITQRISKEAARASYLINVPVLKRHGGAGVSMGLKNHYGTISDPNAIHPWTMLGGNHFPNTCNVYSPIVELNQNPHIRGKTVLVVGDALFGAFDNNGDRSKPARWSTFNNQSPRSLFFATDPVAVDSVMCDLIQIEQTATGRPIDTRTLAHLSLAAQAGLGTYEQGDPWRNSYTRVKYHKLTL